MHRTAKDYSVNNKHKLITYNQLDACGSEIRYSYKEEGEGFFHCSAALMDNS